jgi:polyisoprenoid-binding protein YceI
MTRTYPMTNAALAAPRATTRWSIDPAHTSVQFGVRHLMISTVKGRFAAVEGTVSVPAGDPERAQIQVVIDAASIATGVEQRDDHLRSSDFFDVAHFPTLTFRSRRVERTGADTLRLVGDLTIRDLTREVQLDVEELGAGRDPWGGQRSGFAARGKLNRRDFGLTWNQMLETGGVLVGEDVSIVLDVQLVEQAA